MRINTSAQIKVELKDLRPPVTPPLAPGGTRSGIAGMTRSGITPGVANAPMPGLRVPNGGVAHPMPPNFNKSSDIFGTLMKLSIVALLGFAGWWSWKTGLLNDFLKKDRVTQTKNGTNDAGTVETASKVHYQVTILSDPPGARIYFDCVDKGAFAPKIFNMEGNKSVHVTLKKDGYYPYEIDFTPVKDAQSLQATMQPLGRAAYLTVNVVNGGANPILEVNGRRICDNAPSSIYPIPAGVPVQIRARNAFTGAMAETTVTLDADQRKTVELILNAGAGQ